MLGKFFGKGQKHLGDERPDVGDVPPDRVDGGREKRPKTPFVEGASWEARHMDGLQRSETRAWWFAKIALGSAVLPWVGIVVMLPLKESIPYVIKEDRLGASTLLTRVNWTTLAYDEVRDKSWAAQYVEARERYDWYSLQDDYNFVAQLSSTDVATEYSATYTGETSRDKTLGNATRVKVKILSVVPSGNGTATIRFQTTQGNPDGSGRPVVASKVATIGYRYVDNSVLPENERLKNPFGFRVTTYRVDADQLTGAY